MLLRGGVRETRGVSIPANRHVLTPLRRALASVLDESEQLWFRDPVSDGVCACLAVALAVDTFSRVLGIGETACCWIASIFHAFHSLERSWILHCIHLF